MSFKTKFLTEQLTYDGTQLAPHWINRKTELYSDAMVGFCGLCAVPTEHLVDLVDKSTNDTIQAKEMLHFLEETFQPHLPLAVFRQRLFICVLLETLSKLIPDNHLIIRQGDDLYYKDRKLTVSIATVSAVSNLIHTGVNIDPSGAPVPAIGLKELGVDVRNFAEAVLKNWKQEISRYQIATCKVLPR